MPRVDSGRGAPAGRCCPLTTLLSASALVRCLDVPGGEPADPDGGCCRCACDAGYFGLACEHTCPRGTYGAVCSARGGCTADANGLTGRCQCAYGYYGPACEESCPGSEEFGICNGRGLCMTATGMCACFPGARGLACEDGGLLGVAACPGQVEWSDPPCHGHGECNTTNPLNATCTCDDG